MVSDLQNPLPQQKPTTHRVIVCFYNGRWIPIMYYSFSDAIQLCDKARLLNQELFIFPEHFSIHHFSSQADYLPCAKHHVKT